jgi:hypothetical protein
MKRSLIFSGILTIRLVSIGKAMILALNIDLLSFIMIVYDKMGEPALEGEAKTLIINQLITACALNGFIEPVWIWWKTSSSRQMARTWSGRIRMTPRGRRLCKHREAVHHIVVKYLATNTNLPRNIPTILGIPPSFLIRILSRHCLKQFSILSNPIQMPSKLKWIQHSILHFGCIALKSFTCYHYK